ncbi:MAG: hypothetical protein R3352_02305 [Salinisphaeraceae bacterium]|nr:hypothetical protein [Salinisphaeraceae bacterium]
MDMILNPLILNFLYAAAGGCLAIFFSYVAVKLFSHFMTFSVSQELGKGNVAVGLAVMGIFIGVGVSLGLVIGLGLN